MASVRDYCRSALRVSVAQICMNLGWNATQSSTLELLTDVLERYLEEVGTVSHRYCEQFGRTEPNLDDLGLAFRHLGINLGELEDYVRHVDPVPFAHSVVAFPAPKNNNLQFPNPNSREILHHREEHVHPHLPYMFPGMEDEVKAAAETTETPTLAPQPPVQEGSPMDVTSPSPEKRPAPVSDGPPPTKRPRMTASNLPEEAAHSQYEMTSVVMSNGFLTPTRGKGRLPDSRTPPPAIRHTLTFTDTPAGPNRAVDGSEANKENNAEPAVRVILSGAGGKEPSAVGASQDSVDASNRPEGETVKPKKKAKDGVRAKKLKKKDVRISVVVGDGIAPTAKVDSAETGPVKKTKVAKEGKVKKLKEGKAGKLTKNKNKDGEKKKVTMTPLLPQTEDVGGESRLKELLLSKDKLLVPRDSQPGPSTDRPASGMKKRRSPSPDSSQNLRQAFQPTDIFESPSSRENSPGQLVIAEAEGRAQEREEERQARLKSIDESITNVIRDSVTEMAKKGKDSESSTFSRPSTAEKKKRKPKEKKMKSSEFISDDILKKEEADELSARSEKSMNDTIDAVIRRGMEEVSQGQAQAQRNAQATVDLTVRAKKDKKEKEGKKKKLGKDKDKSPIKKKLKEKLETKPIKIEDSGAPPVEQKPFVSDKYSSEELKVYEFGESPPGSPQEMAASRRTSDRRPSARSPSPPPPPPPPELASPTPERQPVTSPEVKPFVIKSPTPEVKPLVIKSPTPELKPLVIKSPTPERKPLVIKSPTPETATVNSSASTSSVTSAEQLPIKPLKIEIPREKEKHKDKEKSKDKERKKEKKRDKEKKKKNKDKDRSRDRDRHDKHEKHSKHDRREREEKLKEEKPAENPGFKLKIKFGSLDGSASSVTVTEKKASPAETAVRQEPPASPSRKQFKLVIKCGDEKHTSRGTKAEPPNSPPVLKREVTPPPPVLVPSIPPPVSSPPQQRSPSPQHNSPFSSPQWSAKQSPPSKFTFEMRGRSPARSPVSPVYKPFTSPASSPPHRRYSHSPPPRTPSPSRKSPSPMPQTPSPIRHRVPSSPSLMSSPMQHSPCYGHKSPTPTPKTPSLSPAYHAASPAHSDHSPAREKTPPPVIKPLFGTPERETSPPPSPLFADAPVEEEKDIKRSKTLPPPLKKPKGKVGRPRSKSPRVTSPRGAKSPKGLKSPKALGAPKLGRPPKNRTGRSPGRPPKAKTLAARAAAAAAGAGLAGEVTSAPKPRATPKTSVTRSESGDEESPPPSPAAEGSHTTGVDRSRSPSPTSPGMTRGQGTVEVETVGFFINAYGEKIWICPACKMQDDGSPMIGCDKCDDWYHWVCVNITREPPEEEQWYCPRCKAKERNKPKLKPKGKRGRKKKVP